MIFAIVMCGIFTGLSVLSLRATWKVRLDTQKLREETRALKDATETYVSSRLNTSIATTTWGTKRLDPYRDGDTCQVPAEKYRQLVGAETELGFEKDRYAYEREKRVKYEVALRAIQAACPEGTPGRSIAVDVLANNEEADHV